MDDFDKLIDLTFERDDWRRQAEQLKAERDVLAGHVEQANLLVDAYRKIEGSPLYLASRITKWRDEAPATSLDRLIKQKQAEAVEKAADGLNYTQGLSRPARDWMAHRANDLRRQAEEE